MFSFVGTRKGSRRSAVLSVRLAVAVASSVVQGSADLFPSLMLCKGEVMSMYVTWSELIELLLALITLAFVILSYLNSKKR